MFSNNGDGLKLHAVVDYTYANDWMLFALWYSMQKNLPDAELVISCSSPQKISRQFFSWCKKCNVPFSFGSNFTGVIIPADIIMVRELAEGVAIDDIGAVCSVCEHDEITPFVSYGMRVGNFVVDDWINTMECPFSWADRFLTASAGVNEVKILKLWKQMAQVYANVSRG